VRGVIGKKLRIHFSINTVKGLLALLERDPFEYPPEFEQLYGDLSGAHSRRINRQHRLVYMVLPNIDGLTDDAGVVFDGIVKVISMWTHYERVT
jgi:Txe/YoeB family toxin of toxin-antitoxin system